MGTGAARRNVWGTVELSFQLSCILAREKDRSAASLSYEIVAFLLSFSCFFFFFFHQKGYPTNMASNPSNSHSPDAYHFPFAKKIVFKQEEILARIKEVAARIAFDYKDKVSWENPLICVAVLKGSYMFMADLARALADYGVPVKNEFICVSSYGSGTVSSGEVRMLLDLRVPIQGQHVLLVEDIVDTARTLDFLHKIFGTRSPASLKMATLLNKKARRVVPLNVEYSCFDCPDCFLVGYGLDYAEKFRELRDIADLDLEKYKENERRQKSHL